MKPFENDHNVYILGAGFSRAAGLPLISDFLVQMRDSHPWLIANKREKEAKAVKEVLAFRLNAASAAYWVNLDLENIEELFSLASTSAGEMDSHICRAIAATLDFARQTKKRTASDLRVSGESKLFCVQSDGKLKSFPKWVKAPAGMTPERKSDAPGIFQIQPYTYYVARLLGMFFNGEPAGENTFVTFNYDTVLEDALAELGVSPCYFPAETEQPPHQPNEPMQDRQPHVAVLKLHGSVNWPKTPREDATRLSRYECLTYELLRDQFEPFLIPPTWKKSLGGPLEGVWDSAVRRLKSATRVIIIGFSIPPTDLHFKYLMAAGLQSNVSLRQILFVNAFKLDHERDTFKQRVKMLLRPDYVASGIIDFQFSTLDEFTRDMGPTDHKIHLINRPIENGVTVGI